jgi:hypothetical protein
MDVRTITALAFAAIVVGSQSLNIHNVRAQIKDAGFTPVRETELIISAVLLAATIMLGLHTSGFFDVAKRFLGPIIVLIVLCTLMLVTESFALVNVQTQMQSQGATTERKTSEIVSSVLIGVAACGLIGAGATTVASYYGRGFTVLKYM